MEEAVRWFTLNNAWITYEEDTRGSIKAGKLADLVVLDRDIFSRPPRELLDTRVLYTLLDGRIVFENDPVPGAMPQTGSYEAGALYSIEDEEGYRVAKILVVDDIAVHIRIYKQRFPKRPSRIDPAKLTLGTIHDPDGFGFGHLPIRHRQFDSWKPVFIMRTHLTDAELEGYREWKSARGGVWDIPPE
jgi:hypothetical protein